MGKLNHIALVCVLTGLTGCGGATTSQPSSTTPVPTAPLVIGPAKDSDVQQPADTESSVTQQQAPGPDVVEQPPTDLPQPEPVEEYVVNQAVIAGAGDVVCEADLETLKRTILEMTNASRIEARMCGTAERSPVGVLSWNDNLTEAARSHAADMSSNNFFSHDGSDGLAVSDRASTANYPWRAIGENIAAGQISVEEVQQGWIESPGHCRNIMNKLYTEMGAACIRDPDTDFGSYWVVVFGASK